MAIVVDVLKGGSFPPLISLSSSFCLLTLVPGTRSAPFSAPFLSSFNKPLMWARWAWHDFSSWHFKINYNIGFLTRKALLVLPPAYRHSEVHQIPVTQSTYESLTCPTNGSLAPPTQAWLVSPLFSTSGHFPWVGTHLSSVVSCLLASSSPGTRQPRLSRARSPWLLFFVWCAQDSLCLLSVILSDFLGC